MSQKPFEETLWTDCLFEEIQHAKEQGLDHVNFELVDARALRKAHSIRSGDYSVDVELLKQEG